MFGLVGDFFENQGKVSEDWKPMEGLQSYHPLKDQIDGPDQNGVKGCLAMLKKYHEKLSNQAKEMDGKVLELNQKIKAAYGKPDLMKYPYHLHSICVHDGNAQSGHYYTFIYDRFQKKWRKFNDIRVTEVSEEDVFKESEGGYSWQTAYWIVYVQDSIAKDLEQNDINQYKVPENPFVLQGFENHYYGKRVPGEINLILEKENQALAKEIDDHQN